MLGIVLGTAIVSSIPCNILVVDLALTPPGILPEWYLVPFFA